MKKMNVKLKTAILLICILFRMMLYSQSITPFTNNNGGGYSSNLEWSLMESVSISNFISSGYSLNTGFLQPLTNIVTSINEYGPLVFGNQITIGPNPTINLLHIKTRFNETGRLSIQLLDSKSSQIFTQDAGIILNIYENDLLIEKYPSGIYYIKIYFKPIIGSIKTGIYKIIKL
jgi:hypothetical protein